MKRESFTPSVDLQRDDDVDDRSSDIGFVRFTKEIISGIKFVC